jgi:hypothetical protein
MTRRRMMALKKMLMYLIFALVWMFFWLQLFVDATGGW